MFTEDATRNEVSQFTRTVVFFWMSFRHFLTLGWHGHSHTSFQAACNVVAKLLTKS